MLKPQNKINKQGVFNLVSLLLLVLTHVAIIGFIVLSFRYYSIYPALFGSAVAIIVCLLIIIDIVFIIGIKYKDKLLKIITVSLTVLMFIGGTFGALYVAKANGIVNSILDDGSDKYETISGTFAYYDKDNKNNFSSLADYVKYLTELDKNHKFRVGLINEENSDLSSIAVKILDKEDFDYGKIDYKTNDELIQALIDGDIDVIALPSGYKGIYEKDENSSFGPYLEYFKDLYTFSQDLKIETSKSSKNIAKEPFNVLLIGYSRTEIGSSVGLADSIILATINPQTYTVSMMSIARDSFVPIACYGGEMDKINSGRSTSRACFIETVENFVGMDIDYYMELDYLGLVQIVNTVGGVEINNPVEFTLDGIYVPAGKYLADGQQALQFCRERHSMPNGDFDRQQHQKEVIIAIAKTFIEKADINLALDAMEAASEWMSTDMTLNQLTGLFNLLLNTKNYTGLKTFDLVDFNTLRITGDGGIKYYSYSMRLPLWVYLIYEGSYNESIGHIKNVMGEYTTIAQVGGMEYSTIYPYVRAPFYSSDYENKFVFEPEPMPPFWASLSGMSLDEAMSWANENGVSLTIKTIDPAMPEYDANYQGRIVEQEPRYGALISEYKSGTITIMGSAEIDESKQVPFFVGRNYTNVIEWANRYGVSYKLEFDKNAEGKVGDVVSQSYPAYTPIGNVDRLVCVVKAGVYDIEFITEYGTAPSKITVTTGDDKVKFKVLDDYTSGGVRYVFGGWFTEAVGGTRVSSTYEVSGNNGTTVKLYAHWSKAIDITYDYNYSGASSITRSSTEGFPSDPRRDHFQFLGWFTSQGGGQQVSDLSIFSSNVTLYAYWQAIDWTDTIEDTDIANKTYGCPLTNSSGQVLSSCTVSGNGDTTNDITCNYVDP